MPYLRSIRDAGKESVPWTGWNGQHLNRRDGIRGWNSLLATHADGTFGALSPHITDILRRQDVIHATALVAVGQAISANSTPLKRKLLKIFRMVVMSLSQGAALDEAAMGITPRCVNASVSNKEAGKVVDLKNRLGRGIRQGALCPPSANLDSHIGLGQSFLGRRRLVNIPHILASWFRDEF